MSELIPWMDKEINKMRREMECLFNRCWPDIGADLFLENISGGILLETVLTEDTFMIRAVLPGIDPQESGYLSNRRPTDHQREQKGGVR